MPATDQQLLLTVFSGPHVGAEIVLSEGEHRLGSGSACDIMLSDPQIAEEHARLVVRGGEVTCAAIGEAKIYVEGAAVNEATLSPYEFLTLGSTHLAIGPAEGDWPTRELPVIQAAASTDADAGEGETSSGENDNAGATSDPNNSVEKADTVAKAAQYVSPQARWTVSLIFLLVLFVCGLLIFAQSDWFGESSTDETVERADLEAILAKLAPAGEVEIVDFEGGFAAQGFVIEKKVARELEDALLEIDPSIDTADLRNTEDIASSARQFIEMRNGLEPLVVTIEKPGDIRVAGELADLTNWKLAKREIKDKTKVVNLIDEVSPPSSPVEPVPPPLPDDDQTAQENAGGQPKTEDLFDEPPATDESEQLGRPFIVRDLTIGRTSFLTTASGVDVREGSMVRGGYKVERIEPDHVVLSRDGKEVVMHFEVQP